MIFKKDYELWAHQMSAFRRAQGMDNLAIFFEAGTGKTATMIAIIRHLIGDRLRPNCGVLILAPLIVVKNWKKEFGIHSWIDQTYIHALSRSSTRVKDLRNVLERGGEQIIIMNYEALRSKTTHSLLMEWSPDILVCDESHRCKSPKGKGTDAVIKIADNCKNVYLLTGTPILNDARDIWAQYRILDGGKTFGKNFYVFQKTYFEDANQGWSHSQKHFPKYVPRAGSLQRINLLLSETAVRAKKSECLTLPPVVNNKVEVEMASDQKRMYIDMKQHMIAYLDESEGVLSDAVVAQTALTRSLRLLQITSGYYKAEDSSREVSFKKNPKLEVLKELLADLTPASKVIVWACFQQNIRDIKKLAEDMGIEYAEVWGGMECDRFQEIERFNNDPSTRIMVSNQSAGGIGINLVASDTAITFSRNYSLADFWQSRARNYRGGSEIHSKVTYYDLVVPESIDELALQALMEKQSISDKVLDWIRE